MMRGLLCQLLRFKPDFLPVWLYLLLVFLLVLFMAAAMAFGVWFVSTQIEFM